MPYALFLLKLDAIDVAFFVGALSMAIVLILAMNPLSSWVGKLLDYQREKDRKSRK